MPHCTNCRRYFSIGGRKYTKCKECKYKPTIIYKNPEEEYFETHVTNYVQNNIPPTQPVNHYQTVTNNYIPQNFIPIQPTNYQQPLYQTNNIQPYQQTSQTTTSFTNDQYYNPVNQYYNQMDTNYSYPPLHRF